MASRQIKANGIRNARSSRPLTTDNRERTDSMGSRSAEAANDMKTLNPNESRALGGAICDKDTQNIVNIRSKFGIDSHLAQFIPKLRDYEIVFVCDDSKSMTEIIARTGKSRWEELCEIVKKLLPITMEYDSNGVDIHFLNRESYLKVKDPRMVDHAFSEPPIGYTLLVPILTEIFQSPMAAAENEKKLLVFVATDGKPTDESGKEEVDNLKRLLRKTRNSDTTYVSFLLCTDEQEPVNYMENWDRTMIHVDVTDDYETELDKIRRCQENPHYVFSEDDYIVKALVGSIIPHIDRLNETRRQ